MGPYYDDLLVFWLEESEFNEYVDDVSYDQEEEIEENIEDLRENVQPIKDLIFGFSTIIIENPDYDGNGIVESEEMDQWFNGIIGLLIVIVIYIFYKGLNDR